MNTRTVRFIGLAAVATLLAGCAAQYGHPNACEQEMRQRLADTSQQGPLTVTHRAVSWRGQRVVIEGHLASTVGAPNAASAGKAQPKPTTPVAIIEHDLGVKKPTFTPAAAECTFDESGLTSFRWLAPAVLAKTTTTTPAPAH